MTYYDNIAVGYEELHKDEQLRKIAVIKKHVQFHEKWDILDVGCGPYFGDFQGFVVGVDPSINLLEQAKKKIPVIQGLAEYLPFHDNTFMAVVSITAIQNFDDIERGLLEIKRVAREFIIISILCSSPKVSALEQLIPKHIRIEKIVEEDKDIIFFCRKKHL